MLDDTVNILTDNSLEGISASVTVYSVLESTSSATLVNGFIVDIELEVARLGLSTVVFDHLLDHRQPRCKIIVGDGASD